jgi:hypothetical protein
MGPNTGRTDANWYPAISAVRSGSDGGDQHREGLTTAGGAAPSRGGEVTGVGAGACYDGSGVAGVGQNRRGRLGEVAGGVVATRPGSERGERRRKGSERVGVIPVRNSDHGEGQSTTTGLG